MNVQLTCLQIVHGEIYYVDDNFMTHLDHFEGYPVLYQRDIIRICVISLAGQECSSEVSSDVKKEPELVKCNTYLLNNFDQELLHKETFVSYDSSGQHGKPYQPV